MGISEFCRCGHEAAQHEAGVGICLAIHCACTNFVESYETQCECGHLREQHEAHGYSDCRGGECGCYRYVGVPVDDSAPMGAAATALITCPKHQVRLELHAAKPYWICPEETCTYQVSCFDRERAENVNKRKQEP